jgi:thiol-disulfide isomerase/thioredoxin
MKNLITIFLVLFLSNSPSFAENKNPPQLVISSKDGKNFDLKNNLGKITILVFWVSWCENCKDVMAMLDEISKEKNPDVEIVGISIDKEGQRETFNQMSAKFSYKNFMLLDAKVNDFSEPRFTPQIYIVNKKGHSFIAPTPQGKNELYFILKKSDL